MAKSSLFCAAHTICASRHRRLVAAQNCVHGPIAESKPGESIESADELRCRRAPAYPHCTPIRSHQSFVTNQHREEIMTWLRLTASNGLVLAAVCLSSAALAQAPAPAGPTAANPWILGAPFPDASEEV